MPKEKPKHEKPHKPHTHEHQEELQEKYIELQLLKQQISSLIEQKQAIDERENELTNTIEALKKLDTLKKGSEMWSTLGSGAFVRSDIKDTEKVLVAIGAGLVIRETVPKSIEILESRLAELSKVSNEVVQQATVLIERINKLEPEVQKLAEKQ